MESPLLVGLNRRKPCEPLPPTSLHHTKVHHKRRLRCNHSPVSCLVAGRDEQSVPTEQRTKAATLLAAEDGAQETRALGAAACEREALPHLPGRERAPRERMGPAAAAASTVLRAAASPTAEPAAMMRPAERSAATKPEPPMSAFL